MTDLIQKSDDIINLINEEVKELSTSERAMVILYVCKLCKSTVELDVVDAIKNATEEERNK